jgi:hypothetical protein
MKQLGLKRAPFALILALSLATSYAGTATGAFASDEDGSDGGDAPPAVVRIAAADGQVAVRHGTGGAEMAATVNAPLEAGDYLSTGRDGRVEVQLDADTIVRAGANAQLRFTQLDGQADIAQLAQGSMEVRILRDDQPSTLQIQTPSVNVEPAQSGAFLVTVRSDGDTEVTARSGSLEVITPQGNQQLDPGRSMLVAGNASDPHYQYVDEVATTGLEQWGDQRDSQLLAADNSGDPYVGSDVAGAADLNAYGQWVDIPGYGNAWVPSDVSSSWTPYSDGTWAYEPYYGYTWVGAEPWGWAPYHYGRWLYAPSYGWAWSPGRRDERQAWSPALVAFFGFGGGSGLGLGFGNIGWVPLAPGENCRPWWGAGNSLELNVSFNDYHNYEYGFVGVPVSTWQHGVIRNVHVLSGAQVARTRFYGGSVAVRGNAFNTHFTYRRLAANVPRPPVQRFNAMRPIGGSAYRAPAWQRFGNGGAPSYARTVPVQRQVNTGWQRFDGPQRSYQAPQRAFPSYQRYQAPQRSYQAPQRSYQAPQRSYQAPQRSFPSYQRYQAPQRSYQAPQRSYQAPQRAFPSYQRYQAPQRSYQAPQRSYQAPQRSYRAPQRSNQAPQARDGGGRPHRPGGF